MGERRQETSRTGSRGSSGLRKRSDDSCPKVRPQKRVQLIQDLNLESAPRYSDYPRYKKPTPLWRQVAPDLQSSSQEICGDFGAGTQIGGVSDDHEEGRPFGSIGADWALSIVFNNHNNGHSRGLRMGQLRPCLAK